jgi:hypothetical protein
MPNIFILLNTFALIYISPLPYISLSINTFYSLILVVILTSNSLLNRHLKLNYLNLDLLNLLSLIILLIKENTDLIN